MSESASYYQLARRRGVSRRDFLKFCALMGAMLGLDADDGTISAMINGYKFMNLDSDPDTNPKNN